MPDLRDLVAGELSQPVDPRVRAFAAAIAARHRAASRAVLFYGSCLRETRFDGLMLDFYLIVSEYRSAYDKRWLAVANRLIPPNVFYAEHDRLAYPPCHFFVRHAFRPGGWRSRRVLSVRRRKELERT